MKTMALLRDTERQPFIPILMYHGIGKATGARHPYFETSTSPEMFASQMRYLSDHGYRSIGLEALTSRPAGFERSGRKMVITFDDGYHSFYTEALPVLARYGFRASIFIVSSFAQKANDGFNGSKHMNWHEIREILNMGNEIGSHTVSHPILRNVSPERLLYEIEESKNVIEQETGTCVNSFAYPYAFPEHDAEFISVLRTVLSYAGYARGVCTTIGTVKFHGDPLFLPRIPINSQDDLCLFEAKVSGGYDWMGIVQSIYKRFRWREAIGRQQSPAEV
jgi:peptidoglycan/xylan/chitin deacetylase (PgdA/CDA1 family)